MSCSGAASAHSSDKAGVSWLGLVTVRLEELFHSQIEKRRGVMALKGRYGR